MSEKQGKVDGISKTSVVIIDGVSYDRRVSCKVRTKYPTATPIYERRFYIEGAGQLCETCFHRIYEDHGSI